MGTTIPPFSLVRVAKTVDKPTVTPNEELTYTIRVSNVGHKDLPANALTINDVLDSLVTYVQSSTRISASAGSTTLNAVADQTTGGTRFPLDEAGFVIPIALPRRGGTIEIVFKVKAAAELGTSKIINTGSLTQIGGGKIPFEATSTVFIDAAVTIENTVYQGHDGGAKCGTSAAVESITTTLGAAVTYCYRIKNTGKTPLSSVTITTRELNFTRTLPGSLAPDASQPIFVNQFNNGTLINNAVVLASPALANGNRIRHADNVTATDPSNVVAITPIARLNVSNVVYIGIDNGARCHTGVEKVVGIEQTEVVFCFCIVNTGDTHLNDIRLSNPRLGGYTRTLDTLLAPGQNVTVSLSRTIDESETNVVEVTATPVLSNGMLVPGLSAVKNSDPSQTDEISYSDIIRVDNTVYLGHDGGAKVRRNLCLFVATVRSRFLSRRSVRAFCREGP
jgi:uncharacterized repeat protein (TIGR01451 family)